MVTSEADGMARVKPVEEGQRRSEMSAKFEKGGVYALVARPASAKRPLLQNLRRVASFAMVPTSSRLLTTTATVLAVMSNCEYGDPAARRPG